MGDKSPKAKDKQKKQAVTEKNQKKADIAAKTPAAGVAGVAKKAK